MIVAQRTRLNNLLNQKTRLVQEINGLKWQITSLKEFSSIHQIRAWRKHKRYLTLRLNYVKSDIKALQAKINGQA
jgi:hypothetical protein